MAKRPRETFYLAEEEISKLRSVIPFLNLTQQSQEMLEEFLQSAFGGINRVENKLLGTKLKKARDLLSLEEQSSLWPQLKTEIENALSKETPPSMS